MSQLQRLLHAWPAQVEIAIFEPRRLVGFDFVLNLKRRSLGRRNHFQLRGDHLDLTCRHTRVLGTRGAPADCAFRAHHVLRSQFRSDCVCFGCLGWVEHDLHCAPAVAQVDEDQASMVPAASLPAVQLDVATHIGRAHGTAVRSCEAAHAMRAGRSAHATSACSPLTISLSWAVWPLASSSVSNTTHRAPSLLAERIFARKLLRSESTAVERTVPQMRATSAAATSSSPSGSTTTSAACVPLTSSPLAPL